MKDQPLTSITWVDPPELTWYLQQSKAILISGGSLSCRISDQVNRTQAKQMEKFATLEPVRLYASSAARAFSSPQESNSAHVALIGSLPVHIHAQILKYLPLPDIPSYARACRAANAVVSEEGFWLERWDTLTLPGSGDLSIHGQQVEGHSQGQRSDEAGPLAKRGKTSFEETLDLLEGKKMEDQGRKRAEQPAVASVLGDTDDFGDFADAGTVSASGALMDADDEMGDFVGGKDFSGSFSSSGAGLTSHSSSHSPFSLSFFHPAPKPPLPPSVVPLPLSTRSGPPSHPSMSTAGGSPQKSGSSSRERYKRAHNLLKPLATSALAPSTPPHLVLTTLTSYLTPASSASSQTVSSPLSSRSEPTSPASAKTPSMSPALLNQSPLVIQSTLLSLLSRFLSVKLQPLRAWRDMSAALRAAMDRFDASLLAAFDMADGKGDEQGMREAAEASWGVWCALDGGSAMRVGSTRGDGNHGGTPGADWEMGKVWAEKREIFYEQGRWDPLDNFTSENTLDFTSMDEFIVSVLSALKDHGARAIRVFPPPAQVLLAFAERIAGEVVGEYIATLLSKAREIQSEETNRKVSLETFSSALGSGIFLKAAAAVFREAWRMVDIIMSAAAERQDSAVRREQAEDVVYQMFESNMDEYLDEEVESVKQILEVICKGWDRNATTGSTSSTSITSISAQPEQPRFLSSQNPAQVKRNVLASFTSVLLLPVTIVPRVGRGVGGVLLTGGNAAVQGIAMLNPQRWGATGGVARQSSGGGVSATGWGGNASRVKEVDGRGVKDDGALFEVGGDDGGVDEEEENESDGEKEKSVSLRKDEDPWAAEGSGTRSKESPTMHSRTLSSRGHITPPASAHAVLMSENKLELLLSLDVALEVIHADRESLKRVETFAGYPGHYGHRVRDTIEEVFILMLQALGDGHLSKGFGRATEQMMAYKPADHAETTNVAPLLQFFELVHIGDTIQSMVQVYFDKELAHHIDRTDFLNAVVREKKRFENSLDDSVAAGLNAGTEALMNQVEHIILTLTKPREYYPPEDGPLELSPTKGCTEAIKCLDKHCRLLKGSTSKEVLEVFYQEVGIRLIAILQKHIKRQIISLNGGFQVIADLNTYHTFISSLKVPSITSEFSHLKMLGHVYVVEDAKDLAQIVRDVTRYGGAYRPEDIYEFIQRRSDWKKIEKTVDKTMYNLSFKEDCIIS